jgi:hypothetical protein
VRGVRGSRECQHDGLHSMDARRQQIAAHGSCRWLTSSASRVRGGDLARPAPADHCSDCPPMRACKKAVHAHPLPCSMLSSVYCQAGFPVARKKKETDDDGSTALRAQWQWQWQRPQATLTGAVGRMGTEDRAGTWQHRRSWMVVWCTSVRAQSQNQNQRRQGHRLGGCVVCLEADGNIYTHTSIEK